MSEGPHYVAGGGVVTDGDRVLVLLRPSRKEVRLPKGHVEGFETVEEGALRETIEETGYPSIEIIGDLGSQTVEFVNRWYSGARTRVREERFFLMKLLDDATIQRPAEDWQFDPRWMTWDEAEAQ
ncbi:MAG: NUDIX domain-containing protein, partial [Actinomycetota bacterium]